MANLYIAGLIHPDNLFILDHLCIRQYENVIYLAGLHINGIDTINILSSIPVMGRGLDFLAYRFHYLSIKKTTIYHLILAYSRDIDNIKYLKFTSSLLN